MRPRAMLLLSVLCVPAQASIDALSPQLRHCAAEVDQLKRLACFDDLVATLPKVEADQFGLTAEIARARMPSAEHKPEDDVLPGKIVSLGQSPHGHVIFTLDNQQVWIQTDVEPGKRFSIGDDVHIEHGAMGSWWLAADKARKTRVKRVS